MKYIDANRLRKEIDHRIDILEDMSIKCAKNDDTEMHAYYHGKAVSLQELLSFIDSFQQEQPSDDLEEAADKYEQEYFTDATLGEAYITGAEWQMKQMLKDAVEGEIQMRYSGCLCAKTIRAINEDKFKLGDKVRIIIVKEEK